ncbi:MAG: hypothetical protein ABI740_06540 [Alphaproteobacteria bacterium]
MHRRNLLKAMTAAGMASGFALGALAPAIAEPTTNGRWRRLESANFIGYSAAAEAAARNEMAALEAFHGLLARLIPESQGGKAAKLPVYFAATVHDFNMAAPWANENIAGFYTSNLEEIHAVVAVSAGREHQSDVGRTTGSHLKNTEIRAFDPRLILFHEYVHHFMYANMRAAYPRWYVEGFAEYLSTADFSGEGVYLGKVSYIRGSWLANGSWLPVEKLLNFHPTEKWTEEDEALFYAQAWLIVHYFFNTPERAKGFDRYVRALTAGGDLIGAFEPSFGISVATFDKELRAYRGKSLAYRFWPGAKIDPSIPITIEHLAPSADDLLMPASYVRERPDAKTGAQSLKSIRELAKKYPSDPFAMRAQATAEIWLGDLDVARQQLDALLKIDTSNAETYHLNGLCELRAGYATKDAKRIAAAAGSFAAAHRLDGSRASSLFRYVECNLFDTGQVDDDSLNILLAAYELAPQVDSIAMTLAHALIQHKQRDEAVTVLRALASDAHGGEMSRRAGQVIADTLAGKEIGMAFYGSANASA